MKSAYELAMERLNQSAPLAKISEEQRKDLVEIESLYRSKIAEREVFLKSQIDAARKKGPAGAGEVAELEVQLSRELRRLDEERDEKKEAVRRRGVE